MNGQQKFLEDELNRWRKEQKDALGLNSYGSARYGEPPASVRRAEEIIARQSAIVSRWRKSIDKRRESAERAVNRRYHAVYKSILFDKIEVARRNVEAL